MPLTPLHLGPGLLFGVLTLKFLNFWAILLGSIAIDIEPTILLLINQCYSCPHHWVFHSILGAIFGSLIIAIILYCLREKLNQISLRFKTQQPFSFKILFFSSFFGWLIHILFDSLTHFDVFPFWPSKYNPFFIGKKIYWPLSLILLILLIFGLILVKKFSPLKNK